MSARFISAVLAVSMTVTALVPLTATPAAADEILRPDRRDTTRLVVGAAALALLGAAIVNKNRQDEKRDKKKEKEREKDRREADRHHTYFDAPRRSQSLPRGCLVDARLQGQVFEAECLERSGVRMRDLPSQCRLMVRTRYGSALGYDAKCVARNSSGDDRRRDRWQHGNRYDATPYLPRRYPGN